MKLVYKTKGPTPVKPEGYDENGTIYLKVSGLPKHLYDRLTKGINILIKGD